MLNPAVVRGQMLGRRSETLPQDPSSVRMRAGGPEGRLLTPSARFLPAFGNRCRGGVSEQQGRADMAPPLSTFWVGAWAGSKNYGRVCSQVPARGRLGAEPGVPCARPTRLHPKAAAALPHTFARLPTASTRPTFCAAAPARGL